MNTQKTSREGTLSEVRRYAISSVLLIALFGLLPAACSNADTDRPDVAGGNGAAASGGSGAGAAAPVPNN
ncbi:MAG TPA: hypothetical protein VJ885_09960 [Thermoanaerobaculia bacterium]|nr:hypothetical protein [Thermoanaerobaculia bacterium]